MRSRQARSRERRKRVGVSVIRGAAKGVGVNFCEVRMWRGDGGGRGVVGW